MGIGMAVSINVYPTFNSWADLVSIIMIQTIILVCLDCSNDICAIFHSQANESLSELGQLLLLRYFEVILLFIR